MKLSNNWQLSNYELIDNDTSVVLLTFIKNDRILKIKFNMVANLFIEDVPFILLKSDYDKIIQFINNFANDDIFYNELNEFIENDISGKQTKK